MALSLRSQALALLGGALLLLALSTSVPATRTVELEDSSAAQSLRNVRAQQAKLEAENMELMRKNSLAGRRVEGQLSAAEPLSSFISVKRSRGHAAKSRQPAASHSAAKHSGAGKVVNSGAHSSSTSRRSARMAAAAKRSAQLLQVAQKELKSDESLLTQDVLKGENAYMARDKLKVIGDEREIAFLKALQASKSQKLAPGIYGAGYSKGPHDGWFGGNFRGSAQADILDDKAENMQAAGVATSKDYSALLNGMHHSGDEDEGAKRLEAAGVSTDRLPLLGTHYSSALPLPIFEDPMDEDPEEVRQALEGGHKHVSAGTRKMIKQHVNVNTPNIFVYGNTPGTAKVDRSTQMFHYADGLDDQIIDAREARRHNPIHFLINDFKQGSAGLESSGVNVWGGKPHFN